MRGTVQGCECQSVLVFPPIRYRLVLHDDPTRHYQSLDSIIVTIMTLGEVVVSRDLMSNTRQRTLRMPLFTSEVST
jgi:hypothetical protein